jgi:hypothetical protein
MTDLLPLVLAGHLIGDWVVQTDKQAALKVWPQPCRPATLTVGNAHHFEPGLTMLIDEGLRQERAQIMVVRGNELDVEMIGPSRRTTWLYNQAHMLTYHLTLLLAIVWAVSLSHLAVIMAVSWVTHSIIDRRWTVRWLMEHTGSAAFAKTSWGVMAVDQALHLAILSILAAVL